MLFFFKISFKTFYVFYFIFQNFDAPVVSPFQWPISAEGYIKSNV